MPGSQAEGPARRASREIEPLAGAGPPPALRAGLNESLQAGPPPQLDPMGVPSLKPTGKVPRMLGHCGGVPGPVPSRSQPCCRPLPSIHGKAPAAPVPAGLRAIAALRPPCSQLQALTRLSLGQGWRKIVSQKSSCRKCGKNPHPKRLQSGGGKSSGPAEPEGGCAELLRGGRSGLEAPWPRGRGDPHPVPVTSCRSWRRRGLGSRGSYSPLRGCCRGRARVLSADPERASVLSDADADADAGAPGLPAVSSSLPTLVGYVPSHLTLAVTGEWGSR